MANTDLKSENYNTFKGYYTNYGFLGYVSELKKFILFATYEEYEDFLLKNKNDTK